MASASTSAIDRSRNLIIASSRHSEREAERPPALRRFSAAAPLRHSIVVSALELDPVRDKITRALEIGRPGLARHKRGRSPHLVELAIAAYFADEDRLGDVV